jgi:DNA replication protein DnaC
MWKREDESIITKTEKICVSVRIRPLSQEELSMETRCPIESYDKKHLVVKKDEKKNFNYDNIFGYESKQNEIFEQTGKTVIDGVIKGFNGTIMVYGQTGSGKTFTMQGDYNDLEKKGIIPRSFEYLFDQIELDTDFTYTVNMSYIQIYLEAVIYI